MGQFLTGILAHFSTGARIMRWTTQTNLELRLRLIAEGRLKLDELTTHTLSLTDIDAETSEMLAEPNGVLGVIIRMQ